MFTVNVKQQHNNNNKAMSIAASYCWNVFVSLLVLSLVAGGPTGTCSIKNITILIIYQIIRVVRHFYATIACGGGPSHILRKCLLPVDSNSQFALKSLMTVNW